VDKVEFQMTFNVRFLYIRWFLHYYL